MFLLRNIIGYLFFLSIFCCHASDVVQKAVWVDAVNTSGPAFLITEKPHLLMDLVRVVTGESLVIEVEDIKDGYQKWRDLLYNTTHMYLEPEAVLIPLSITNSLDTYTGHALEYRDDCVSIFDKDRKSHVNIPRYWPYAWFVAAIDGNTVDIPLWKGRFLAHLFLTSQKDSAEPFHIEAAYKVAACLAQRKTDDESVLTRDQVADLIETRYAGIDVKGLR